jgi:virulence-associated protein VapD
MHVALDAVIVPDRLANVPVGKLLRFRDRHIAELTAFRQHVAGLTDELSEVAAVENLDIAHAHLESLYRKHTKPQLDDLRRALRGQGVESTAGSLGLKVDLNAAAGTVAGSVAAAGGQLAVAGTAIAPDCRALPGRQVQNTPRNTQELARRLPPCRSPPPVMTTTTS